MFPTNQYIDPNVLQGMIYSSLYNQPQMACQVQQQQLQHQKRLPTTPVNCRDVPDESSSDEGSDDEISEQQHQQTVQMYNQQVYEQYQQHLAFQQQQLQQQQQQRQLQMQAQISMQKAVAIEQPCK